MQKSNNEVRIGEAEHLAKQAEEGYGETNFEDAFTRKCEEAKASGFDVVQSDPFCLLLDLDTPEAVAQFYRVFPIVQEHFGAMEVSSWPSKSGRTHTKVLLKNRLGFYSRLILQAALGSDGVREALSLLQYQNGIVEPSVLFKPKS